MNKTSIEELIVTAARGEPIAVEENDRLRAALADADHVRAAHREQKALTVKLGALRDALHDAQAPPGDEEPLRTAFRARHLRRGRPPRLRHGRGLAAALGLAALAAVVVGVERYTRFGVPPMASQENAAGGGAVAVSAFQPLLYASTYSPQRAYSVIRVRVPIAVLAIHTGTELDGTVEADILVGEDGLPVGIRFDEYAGALAASVSQ
jgi:anti-sigma factor RsiW